MSDNCKLTLELNKLYIEDLFENYSKELVIELLAIELVTKKELIKQLEATLNDIKRSVNKDYG